jgi:hypothetical protein
MRLSSAGQVNTVIQSNPLGSAAAPSYTFTGDTDTGLWSPGADTVAWSTGGVERVRINSTGVGIGTSAPAATAGFRVLHLDNQTAAQGSQLRLTSIGTGNTNADGFSISVDATGQVDFYQKENLPLTFGTNNAERVRIDASGNIGIGATAIPAVGTTTVLAVGAANGGTLAVTQAGAIKFRVSATGGGTDFYTADASPQIFYTAGTERMRIASDGKISIGTTVAVASLTVGASAGNTSVAFRDTTNSKLGYLNYNNDALIYYRDGPVEAFRITATGVIQDGAGNELGYRNIPVSNNGGTWAVTDSHRGKCIRQSDSATVTVNGNVVTTGGVVTVVNANSGSMTIAQGSSMTLRLSGTTTTGSRTIAPWGFANLFFTTQIDCMVSGPGVS